MGQAWKGQIQVAGPQEQATEILLGGKGQISHDRHTRQQMQAELHNPVNWR